MPKGLDPGHLLELPTPPGPGLGLWACCPLCPVSCSLSLPAIGHRAGSDDVWVSLCFGKVTSLQLTIVEAWTSETCQVC